MSTLTRSNAARVAWAMSVAMFAFAQVPALAAPEPGDDAPEMAQFRERFKQGLDRYDASDVAGALSFWEPLYRDLGPKRGYRVGYNLARAYEVVGDATRAAERYQSFLDEVKQRRTDGKPIDDVVTTDEAKAIARIDELGKTRGRIHVAPTSPPESVQIDQAEPRLAGFIAYVAPGAHDVIFAPSSPKEHKERVEVQAGQTIEVAAPVESVIITPPPPVVVVDTVKHPFSPTWIWIAGAATLVIGGGLTATAYANAVVLHDRDTQASSGEPGNYNGARTLAYASWTAPASFAVLTIALAVWYALGTKHVKAPITTAFTF